jgi:hypothetical protein
VILTFLSVYIGQVQDPGADAAGDPGPAGKGRAGTGGGGRRRGERRAGMIPSPHPLFVIERKTQKTPKSSDKGIASRCASFQIVLALVFLFPFYMFQHAQHGFRQSNAACPARSLARFWGFIFQLLVFVSQPPRPSSHVACGSRVLSFVI